MRREVKETKQVKQQNIIPGQLSLFDLNITEKIKKVLKVDIVATEIKVLDSKKEETLTNFIIQDNKSKLEKPRNLGKLADKQQQFIIENKIKENENLSKLIFYCCGGLGIELVDVEGKYETTYINPDGIKEFAFANKASVISLDKVIYDRSIEKIKDIKIGWTIEAMYGSKSVVGKVVNRYGFAGETLNIIFDNNTKHTAIHLSSVKKVLSC